MTDFNTLRALERDKFASADPMITGIRRPAEIESNGIPEILPGPGDSAVTISDPVAGALLSPKVSVSRGERAVVLDSYHGFAADDAPDIATSNTTLLAARGRTM